MKEVTIVCDGSSLGNGKANTRAAAVAVLGYKGFWRAFGTILGEGTNQQAEIAAAWVGLKTLREPCKIKLLTDSRYVVETMNGNFRRKANLDWWKKLDEAAERHQISWQWTKGHDGHEIQEIADRMARRLAELGRVDEKILDDAVSEIGIKEI